MTPAETSAPADLWTTWSTEFDRALVAAARTSGDAAALLGAWRQLRQTPGVPSVRELAAAVGRAPVGSFTRYLLALGLPPAPLGRGARAPRSLPGVAAAEAARERCALVAQVRDGLHELTTAQLRQIAAWLPRQKGP